MMTSPLLLMATDPTQMNQPPPETKPETTGKSSTTTTTRGRRPSTSGKGGGGAQKKLPQRGMGVAQLERLRLQEVLKKMTESSSSTITTNSQPDESHSHHQCQAAAATGGLLPFSADPHQIVSSVPLLQSAANYGVPMVNNGGGFWGWDTGLVLQRNGGFGGAGGSGQIVLNHHLQRNVNGADHPDLRVQVGCVVETSKELSSIPKLQQYYVPQNCDVCFKKRCTGENSFNEQVNGFMNMGYAPGGATRSFVYEGNNSNEGVEVVAIHRKGNSSAAGGNSVLMEYEFFPAGKSSRNCTSPKELEVGGEASSSSSPSSSSAAAAVYNAADAANSTIDLSLKLSY